MICARLHGRSVRDCACMLRDGGWAECPPEARRPMPKLEEHLTGAWNAMMQSASDASVLLAPAESEGNRTGAYAARLVEVGTRQLARLGGFTGEMCESCGGANMVRSGTCSTCLDCGSTSGCS